jgi:uncharacterized protein YndB with AHSA1/START domain
MTQETSPRKVARSIQIHADPRRVLDAFLELDQLKQWWGASDGLIDARKGGLWTLGWKEATGGYKYVVSGVIKSLVPEQRLRIDPFVYMNAERSILGPMRLSISVLGKEGRTRIRVRQDGYGQGAEWDWYYESVQTGWTEALKNLKRFLERPAGRSGGAA